MLAPLLLACLLASTPAPLPRGTPPPAQASAKLLDQWTVERDLVLVEAAQRHYEIGLWCWEVGLRPQATTAMIRALEVSDGRFRPAKKTLEKMRRLESDDWKEDPRKPNTAVLRDLARRVRAAEEKDVRAHLELAKWATKKGLDAEARAVYERLFARSGAPLELDEKGCLRIGRTVIDAEHSRALHDAGVTIDGKRYVRDAFLRALPEVGAISEVTTDELRVRSALGAESAGRLHALGVALVPHLERDLGARPSGRLEVFVLARRADYDAYLEAAGLTGYAYGSGVADPRTSTAVVCADGGADLDALVLHELVHLWQFGVTRAVLPDWYEEGLAETYGGPGTFRLDGGELEVGGVLGPERLPLLADPARLLPLATLLEADPAALFAEHGWLFYAQSWAFVRFLREGAGEDVAARFRRWEHTCTGAAVGADETDALAGDHRAARTLFAETFGAELADLEASFRAYVAALR